MPPPGRCSWRTRAGSATLGSKLAWRWDADHVVHDLHAGHLACHGVDVSHSRPVGRLTGDLNGAVMGVDLDASGTGHPVAAECLADCASQVLVGDHIELGVQDA